MTHNSIPALVILGFLTFMAVAVMFLSFRNPFRRSLIASAVVTVLAFAICLPLSAVL